MDRMRCNRDAMPACAQHLSHRKEWEQVALRTDSRDDDMGRPHEAGIVFGRKPQLIVTAIARTRALLDVRPARANRVSSGNQYRSDAETPVRRFMRSNGQEAPTTNARRADGLLLRRS